MMKKIIACFGLFFLNFAVYAALPNGNSEFAVNLPCFRGGIEFGATAMYLKASAAELDYALIQPSPPNQLNEHFKSSRPKYDFGYDFFLGYIVPCTSNNFRLRYSDYQQTDNDHTAGTEGTIFETLAFPLTTTLSIPTTITSTLLLGVFNETVNLFSPTNTIVTGQPVEAAVTNLVRQGAVDLDAGQFINIDNFIRLRFYGGLRYSRLTNKLTTTYILGLTAANAEETLVATPDLPTDITTILTFVSTSQIPQVIQQTSKYEGVGPRFGIDGSFHLGGGVGLVGSLSSALLVGKQQSSLAQTLAGDFTFTLTGITITTSDPTVPVIITDVTSVPVGTIFPGAVAQNVSFDTSRSVRIVPNFEARLGLDYTYQTENFRTFRIEVGYLVNHYINPIDRLTSISTVNPILAPVHVIDTSLSGPYLLLSLTL